MDILAAVRIMLRRWHVVLSGLVLTAVAAFTVMQSIAPTYQAKGSAMIVSPPPLETEEGVNPLSLNPYARFDASTSVLAGVTVEIMNDIDVRERLALEGASPGYQIGQSNSTPVLWVVVVDPDPQQAIRSTSMVLAAVGVELDRRQAEAGAPEESRIRSFVVTEPTRAIALTGARVRAFTAVAVLGLAASISLAFVVEAFAQARRRRRDAVESRGELWAADDGDDSLGGHAA